MMKNPNKKAGNWGALKNKPQNQVYFKDGGKVKVTAGGEKHVIYKKTTKRGEGKVGNVMVNHPTKDKGVWDTIDLTKKAGAKTIKQGVAATKKWHKENPYTNMKKKLTKKQTGGSTPQQKNAIVNKPESIKIGAPKKSVTDRINAVNNKIQRKIDGALGVSDPSSKPTPNRKMQRGGTIAKARQKSLINRYNKASDKLKSSEAKIRNLDDYFNANKSSYLYCRYKKAK
jgi:hypothetical protein